MNPFAAFSSAVVVAISPFIYIALMIWGIWNILIRPYLHEAPEPFKLPQDWIKWNNYQRWKYYDKFKNDKSKYKQN